MIVGAGPTGLTLAHELLRQGVQVRLIEKAPSASQNTKALGVWPRTLELFARTRTGIAQEMLDLGVKTPTFHVWSEGKRLIHLDFTHHLADPYRFALMIPQTETEALLTRHVLDLGGTIERGTELLSLTQQGEGVEVMLRHADGQEEIARTDWLIGCDGAHSVVRHLVGVPFVGKTFPQRFVAGNVRMQWNFPPDEAHAFLYRGNTIAFFPLPEAFRYRVVITYQPGEAPRERSRWKRSSMPSRPMGVLPERALRNQAGLIASSRISVGSSTMCLDASSWPGTPLTCSPSWQHRA